ncbi:GntR family transcriptional regulator [Marispirochaeta aestuarii]|uniref:GntR family transcriptional regulator n=1 Tax=Marispirochaeta aestuarii TaxID=1963862 RepID=UPI0029C803DA|nr:GntR family transcriptional regulator [Marispirochaeta aestuarii]
MGKIVFRTIAEQIFAKLRVEIVNETLTPGAELKEESISERFGVSRGPVREALKELSRYGLISPRGKAGYKVAEPLRPEVRKLIIEIRLMIEKFVIQSLLDDFTEEDIAELETILDGQKKASIENDTAGVWEADVRFHEYMLKKYNDTHVDEMWRSGAYRVMMMKEYQHETLFESYEAHVRILDAIRKKDPHKLFIELENNIQ